MTMVKVVATGVCVTGVILVMQQLVDRQAAANKAEMKELTTWTEAKERRYNTNGLMPVRDDGFAARFRNGLVIKIWPATDTIKDEQYYAFRNIAVLTDPTDRGSVEQFCRDLIIQGLFVKKIVTDFGEIDDVSLTNVDQVWELLRKED